jgi:hypothetical protein
MPRKVIPGRGPKTCLGQQLARRRTDEGLCWRRARSLAWGSGTLTWGWSSWPALLS